MQVHLGELNNNVEPSPAAWITTLPWHPCISPQGDHHSVKELDRPQLPFIGSGGKLMSRFSISIQTFCALIGFG